MAQKGHALVRARSVLVIGGARSGKAPLRKGLPKRMRSKALSGHRQAGDAEMAARIARHQADRGEGWTVLEEPLELAASAYDPGPAGQGRV